MAFYRCKSKSMNEKNLNAQPNVQCAHAKMRFPTRDDGSIRFDMVLSRRIASNHSDTLLNSQHCFPLFFSRSVVFWLEGGRPSTTHAERVAKKWSRRIVYFSRFVRLMVVNNTMPDRMKCADQCDAQHPLQRQQPPPCIRRCDVFAFYECERGEQEK